MEQTYPDKARGWVGFNVPMSHKITAACDILLMPSRFEPCGLNQLYAMAYGTVPRRALHRRPPRHRHPLQSLGRCAPPPDAAACLSN